MWIDIIGYKGLYQINQNAQIKSVARVVAHKLKGKKSIPERILRPGLTSAGYLSVALLKENKPTTYLIHRLLATHFIPNPLNYNLVNHKDGNKTNNLLDNLEWCSASQNAIHAVEYLKSIKTTLSTEQVKQIKILLSLNVPSEHIYKLLNIKPHIVYNIKYGNGWKWI